MKDDTDKRGEPRMETRAVTAGEEPSPGPNEAGDVTMPIHLSSTYATDGIDREMALDDLDPSDGEYVYSRLNNPTRHALEERIASLAGAEYGMAVSSGTAAIVTTVMAMVEPGDHVVAFDDLYGGTKKLFRRLFEERLDVAMTFVDATVPTNVGAAIRPETELLWMESPTNPLLKLCDISAIADIADNNEVTLGVDNTFVSPYFQRPLEMGADVVVHSTTKYLNGHTDSVGGAIVTDDAELVDELRFLQQVGMGNMLNPFDAYQVLRGTKTLHARMRQHETNAMEVARFLQDHPAVEMVHYPGLESHPQHDLANKQMDGFGGVVSFELVGGLDKVEAFVEGMEGIPLAVSLGGVESLIEHPATMTHTDLSEAELEALGLSNSLMRMSVGIEHPDDILESLEMGLSAITSMEMDARAESETSADMD